MVARTGRAAEGRYECRQTKDYMAWAGDVTDNPSSLFLDLCVSHCMLSEDFYCMALEGFVAIVVFS